jgi:hypothetical protein
MVHRNSIEVGGAFMKLAKPRAFATSFAVVAAAFVLGAVAATPADAGLFKKAKPAPVVVQPPAPVYQPVGPITLARPIVDAASAFAAYMQTASAISNKFPDGASVSNALRVGVHSEKATLQQGMVAYGAVIALQDPTFVNAVKVYAANPYSRGQIANNIMADPTYVVSIAGHESAAGLIISNLYAQGARLKAQGELVKQESLDIQLKEKWSKTPVPNAAGRLQEVKTLSSTMDVIPEVRERLVNATSGAAPLGLTSTGPMQPPYTPAVIRSMAIAALAVLGKAGDDAPYITRLLVDNQDGFCFNMSKLNLYQCISVARPYYEDMYCLGLHVMADTGQCVMNSAGGAPGSMLAPSIVTSAGPAAAVARMSPISASQPK